MPDMVTIHRINGETASMVAIDAKQACRNHPQEWAYGPWSDAAKARAQATKSADELERLGREKALSDARDALAHAEDARNEANSRLLSAEQKLKKNKNNHAEDEAREAVAAATVELDAAVLVFEAARAKVQELESAATHAGGQHV
jgi:hypothetical protein